MFDQLTHELLDLAARTRGAGVGSFALVIDCCSCSCCGCIINCG